MEADRQDNMSSSTGIIRQLGEMSADTIIDEAALARIFGRCPTSVKRAIRRGELPPGVKLFGKPTWTAKAVLDHLTKRLEAAKQDRLRFERRISSLAP